MDHFAVWIAAFLTMGIVSFLYKDNPWYKLSEAIFVGISAGYWFIALFWDSIYSKFWLGKEADPFLWVGVFLGVLMLLRLIPKIGWISRWPLAFIVGCTSGLYLINFLASNLMRQVQATIQPLFGPDFGASLYAAVGSIVIVVGTFSGLVYFFFSKEHKGAFGATAKLGIWFIMITFGASFGYTVMSRMSLLIGRIDFLLTDWLGLIR
ncbi:MAG: hypothetical protein KKA42_13430 [candidate division Zixibacteria bacterium]|nr:hypothetical protein [candidate division Zixibacteria bacterium]